VFGCEASSRRIAVSTDGDFIVTSSEEWCTIERDDDDAGSFTVFVEANGDPDSRSTFVMVSHQGLSNRKINITQLGSGPVITVDESADGVLIAAGQPLLFSLTVRANIPVAFDLSDWIHEQDGNEPVTGMKTYFFSVDKMPAGERTGTVVIRAQDAEYYPEVHVEVAVVQRHESHVLTSFSPLTGAVGSEVRLTGNHFGEVLNNVKVYFDRSLAEIVSLYDAEIKVKVPPCGKNFVYNISVVIGSDSLVYPTAFTHIPTAFLKTVTGNGLQTFRPGTLATAQVRARFLSVDLNGNLYATVRDGSTQIVRISEADNEVSALTPNITANASTVDPVSGTVYVTPDNERAYYTVNPLTQTLTKHDIANVVEAETWMGTTKTNYGWAFCPYDNHLYSRYSNGAVLKLDPQTNIVSKVSVTGTTGNTPTGDNRGLAFNPVKPYLLYYVFNPNRIATLDVRDGTYTLLFSSTQPANVDGPPASARFDTPYQICFDSDGKLYIADRNNHSIRVVSTDNIVSTLVGTTKGHADGTIDVAQMDTPAGVCVDSDGTIYIAEVEGCYIRKYVIE
jgi:hypothetical protein